jgi:uncharacterized membrane protein
MRKMTLVFGLLGLLQLTTAYAYIGPGVGAGLFAVILGIIGSIFFAFVGIIWYPIKRLLKGRRPPAAGAAQSGQGPQNSGPGSQ